MKEISYFTITKGDFNVSITEPFGWFLTSALCTLLAGPIASAITGFIADKKRLI